VTGDRPQDVGRSHARRGSVGPETDAILDAYRVAMRAELADTLAEVRPVTGQMTVAGGVAKPQLADRLKLWELAIKLARELAGGSDAGSPSDVPAAPARSARPPKLTARERRSLGG
jgi:hypothetical protein